MDAAQEPLMTTAFGEGQNPVSAADFRSALSQQTRQPRSQQQEIGRILGQIQRADAMTPPLMDAIGRMKACAFARGLDDAMIDAELQSYTRERRL